MASQQARISKDVWEEAGKVAQVMGLANPRQAIEAVFRKYSGHYCQGTIEPMKIPATPAIALTQPDPPEQITDAAADLDFLAS